MRNLFVPYHIKQFLVKSKFIFLFILFFREFVNDEILQDLEDPKDPHHYDYRYLKSKSGPLYQGGNLPGIL